MARELPRFPEDAPTPRMSGAGYPWDEWFNGKVWELVQGVDFPGTVKGFRQNANKKATSMGGVMRSSLLEDGKRLVIQFVKRAE